MGSALSLSMRIAAIFAACCIASLSAAGEDALALIPAPAKAVRGNGYFELTPSTPIVAASRAASEVAPVLADYVARGTGIKLAVLAGAPRDGAVNLRIDPSVVGAEAYRVEVAPARITLSARVLPVARLVILMASGADKAEIMGQVLGDDRDVARWPAQAALSPNAVWVLDRAIAADAILPGAVASGMHNQ